MKKQFFSNIAFIIFCSFILAFAVHIIFLHHGQIVYAEEYNDDYIEDEINHNQEFNNFDITNDCEKVAQSNDRGNKDTTIQGYLTWEDDITNYHSLIGVKVEAYDADSSTPDYLGSTYTNQYGQYTIVFQNDDSIFENGCDVYIKVYAGDDNVYVVDGSDNGYYWTSDVSKHLDVTTGELIPISKRFYMYDVQDQLGVVGQAMQISQALIVARDFAQNQMGTAPSSVRARYPDSSVTKCKYHHNSNDHYIQICSPSQLHSMSVYAAWDVIMHEYGHHIQYQLNIINSPHGSHYINVNMIGEIQEGSNTPLTKDEAIRLTYAEAWATVFGIIAQNEYPYYIYSIQTVANVSYENYKGYSFNLETAIDSYEDLLLEGEACEASIMGVLWDLYDSTNETHDNITLSASDWWEVSAVSGTYTFSDFIQNFYNEHPALTDDIGDNLSYYRMSASNIRIEWGATTSTPPTIKWEPYSGSSNYPLNYFCIVVDNEYSTNPLILAIIDNSNYVINTTISYVLTQAQWDTILSWAGTDFRVRVLSSQMSYPETGSYSSELVSFEKPLYATTLKVDGTLEIIGSFRTPNGAIIIPPTTCGKTVTSIAGYSFSGEIGITSISIPSTITNIGAHAFDGCTSLATVSMSNASITTISDYIFYNCPITSIDWPNTNITSIGVYAFYGNSLSTIVLTYATTTIGTGAFGNANNLTIYDEGNRISTLSSWNSSNRPYVYGCTLSADKSYVVSFSKTTLNPYPGYSGTINNIARSGYTFGGWYENSSYSGTSYSNIAAAPNDVTLYAKYTSNSSGSCITAGSLITLANGTQVAVENLTGNEQLLVWDMYTGTFSSAPILFIDSDTQATYDVITLTFSDGTTVNVIDEHAFFDITLNKYVFLRSDASQYIGHYFTKHNQMLTGMVTVQLTNVSITQQITTAYSPVTYGHLCYYVNGMLSMPGNTESFINIFDVDPETLTYDEDAMAQDIATYGLYTYAEFNSIIPLPEVVFNAFNGQYLKVAIGKGITTLDEIEALLDRYSVFFL